MDGLSGIEITDIRGPDLPVAYIDVPPQVAQSKAALEWIGRLDAHLARASALMGIAEGTVTANAAQSWPAAARFAAQ